MMWSRALADDQVVREMGVFVEGGAGRLQYGGTHPDFRRRGIRGPVAFEAARYAFERLGAETAVTVADEENHAARIDEQD